MNCLPILLALSLSAAPLGEPNRSSPQASAATPDPSKADGVLRDRREEVRVALERGKAIEAERQALETRLEGLNRRIEALKAEHVARSPLWPSSSPSLETLLQDSQELSNLLAQKLEAERQAGQHLFQARERLASALDREIGRLHAGWDRANLRELRETLAPWLRVLHAERRALQLSSPSVSAWPAKLSPDKRPIPTLSAQNADDPELLFEMADAFLDSEDKLRREERAVAQHIERLVHEQELERRLATLMEEDSLFDEGERRISLSRSAHLNPELRATTVHQHASSDVLAPSSADVFAATGAAEQAALEGDGGMASIPTSDTGGAMAEGATNVSPTNKNGTGQTDRGRREFFSIDGAARPFPGDWSESNSIAALRAHQAYLKLKADELHRKAESAARKARDLL
ncbi:MAG: hypothetical protein LBM75_00605 [Myxococcales bacterium]|jgi:hypothetical protein|nr:hypothetical protein [Myxococcales bacterium]